MPVFPGAGSDTQTVAVINGVASVRATAYGNPITNMPEDQPLNAVDGNPATAWTEGAFSPATNQSIQVSTGPPGHHRPRHPAAAPDRPRNRTVTDVTLTFDGGSPVTATLGAASRPGPGPGRLVPDAGPSDPDRHHRRHQRRRPEELPEPERGRLRRDHHPRGGPGHGGPPPADRPPRCGRDRLPLPPARHPAQPRSGPRCTPPRTDPEASMARQFTLPTARTFSIGGTARISTLDPDPVIDSLVGRPRAAPPRPPRAGEATVVSANSSGRLPGDLGAGASAAVDGNPATSWMPGSGTRSGDWVEYQLSQPVTFDHLDLQVVTDGRHSIPTAITVSTPSGSRDGHPPLHRPGVGPAPGFGDPGPGELPRPHRFRRPDHHRLRRTPPRSSTTSRTPQHRPGGLAEVGHPRRGPRDHAGAVPAQLLLQPAGQSTGKPVDISISGSTSYRPGQRGPDHPGLRQRRRTASPSVPAPTP